MTLPGSDETKQGARHSAPDLMHGNQAMAHLAAAGFSLAEPDADGKSVNADTLVCWGTEVKALGDGKVGGYLVVFSGPSDPDLTGDFFTEDTNFGTHKTSLVFYQHGFDGTLKGRVLDDNAALKKDKVGIWVEAQLNMRDEYEKEIYGLAERGKLGWSSGTAGHLVERESMGKAYWIKTWLLGLDASLTPTPAEPRTSVVPLKSLSIPAPAAAENEPGQNPAVSPPAESETKTAPEPPTQPSKPKGLTDMDPKEIEAFEALLDKREAAREAKAKTEAAAIAAQDEAIKAAVAAERRKWEAEMKLSGRRGGYAVPSDADAVMDYAELKTTSFYKDRVAFWKSSQVNRDVAKAMKGYLTWQKDSDGALRDATKASNATDLNETTPGDGGVAVPVGHYQGIIAKCDETSVADKLGVMHIPGKGLTVNVPIETGTANEFVATAETATFDLDGPALDQGVMTLVKYTKDITLSDELLEDEDSKLMAFLDNYVGRALARTYNHLLVTALVAGATATALGGAATIAAADVTKLIFGIKDCYADNAKWLMKRATEGIIRGLVGSFWQFAPTGQGTSMGAATSIWNYPVFHTEFAASPAANAKSVFFGDFSYVGMRDGALSFLRDPYSKASNGQLMLHYYTRTVFKVLQPEAILAGAQTSA